MTARHPAIESVESALEPLPPRRRVLVLLAALDRARRFALTAPPYVPNEDADDAPDQ